MPWPKSTGAPAVISTTRHHRWRLTSGGSPSQPPPSGDARHRVGHDGVDATTGNLTGGELMSIKAPPLFCGAGDWVPLTAEVCVSATALEFFVCLFQEMLCELWKIIENHRKNRKM
jgi:hypothetical protein